MKSHHWDDGIVTKEATCTENGEKVYKCTDEGCDKTYVETIPATGHQHTEIQNKKDATCDEDGYSGDTYCKDCNQIINKGSVIKATGHDWDNGTVTKTVTCKEEGVKTYTCKNCGETKTEAIPKTEHSFDEGVVTKKATCTTDGVKIYTCSVCGETKTEVEKASGHKFNDWKTITEQSVFSGGVQKRICSICGKEETRTIGNKLNATIKTNASSLKLKRRQSTKKFIVSELAKGDSVRSWASSNKKIVNVSGNKKGACTIKAGSKTGKAKITITLASGLKKTITVGVQKGAVACTSIKNVPKKLTLSRKKTYQIKPVINPITCTYKAKYKTSNKKVVKVSSKGKITAVKGKAKITLTVGKKKVTCTVTVR